MRKWGKIVKMQPTYPCPRKQKQNKKTKKQKQKKTKAKTKTKREEVKKQQANPCSGRNG